MDAQSSKYRKHSSPHITLTPTNTHTHNTQQKYTQVPPSTFHKHISPYHPSLSLSVDKFHLSSETVSKRPSCPVPAMLSAVHLCPEPCPYGQSKSHTYSHKEISFMFGHKVHDFETQYQQLTAS